VSPLSGSRSTFDDVYEQTFTLAYRTLRRRGVRVADLDDACQEVFASVDQELKKGTIPRSVKAWVAGIAIRVAEHQVSERWRREAPIDQEEDLTVIAAVGEATDAQAQRAELTAFVRGLVDEIENDQQRHVITLHYLSELSIAEIVVGLNRPEGTVKKQLAAGRRAMDQALARRIARGGKDVVPLFGVAALLESLPNADPPEGMQERVRDRLRELGYGGGGGTGGGAPAAPAIPPGPPVAPLGNAAAPSSWTSVALVLVGAVALAEAGIIAALLYAPRRAPVDVRPDTVAAVVTASAAPNGAPAPAPFARAAPSSRALAVVAPRNDGTVIAREKTVLLDAREALRLGNIKDARRAVEEYAQRWPDGGHIAAEMREMRQQIESYAEAHPTELQVVELGAHRGTP
jgi:RNA polymerase sigma factor (sigma-70 family)